MWVLQYLVYIITLGPSKVYLITERVIITLGGTGPQKLPISRYKCDSYVPGQVPFLRSTLVLAG